MFVNIDDDWKLYLSPSQQSQPHEQPTMEDDDHWRLHLTPSQDTSNPNETPMDHDESDEDEASNESFLCKYNSYKKHLIYLYYKKTFPS